MPTRTQFVRMLSLIVVAVVVLGAAAADAQPRVPRTLVWTAYDVGSAGYIQAASIGHAMAQKEGITLRVVPAGNDVSRQAPLVSGRAQFGALGIAVFLSQEGAFEFGATDWGPQPVRILGAAWGDFNTGNVAAAADTGMKTVFDLKGKRVAWVVGAPALNQNMTAFLACANLTWSDVKKVDFPSWGASARAVVEGTADAYIASTNSGLVYELAASPRKYVPPTVPSPQEDPACWARLKKVAPYFEYNVASVGAQPVSKDSPHKGATYGYPIVSAYANQPADLVYHQTRMLFDLLPEYIGAHPGNDGFALSKQRFKWVVPYHDGAVRYFKEKGVWTAELEKHNVALVQRQEILSKAWDRALAEASTQKVKASDFPKLWMKIRAAALREAGLEHYWEE
ncbi:MAG: TAXI family TRAP transporter solute-binding subunit [Candidatus Rokubacteria bacterium]|nr:TAXI family TRAP transporter solute-binding subunit [Candidatus Rokubacteria bacterium]